MTLRVFPCACLLSGSFSHSLVHFGTGQPQIQACKAFRDIVSQSTSLQYALRTGHVMVRRHVTVLSWLELVEAYLEAWRTFSCFVERVPHVELPSLLKSPVLLWQSFIPPIYEFGGEVRSFVVQFISSSLSGIPERHWRIALDFVVL